MDENPRKHKLLKLIRQKSECIYNKKIDSIIQKMPTRINPGVHDFPGAFKELAPILYKFFQIIWENPFQCILGIQYYPRTIKQRHQKKTMDQYPLSKQMKKF